MLMVVVERAVEAWTPEALPEQGDPKTQVEDQRQITGSDIPLSPRLAAKKDGAALA